MAQTRYAVLASRIPDGGFGRALTSSERANLTRLDIHVPTRTRVLRAHYADHVGALFVPRDGGLSSLGISVTTREAP